MFYVRMKYPGCPGHKERSHTYSGSHNHKRNGIHIAGGLADQLQKPDGLLVSLFCFLLYIILAKILECCSKSVKNITPKTGFVNTCTTASEALCHSLKSSKDPDAGVKK